MATTRAVLVAELKERRGDIGGYKHAHDRYPEVLNQAIRECPELLWAPNVDTTITTLAETRRYSIATLGLTKAAQVRRVWMDDDDGHDQPIGRWEVEDDDMTLTLVLDEDPPEAGRAFTIEYMKPYPALESDGATTSLDRDWLCAKAMTLLLLEADPAVEDPTYLAAQIAYWDQARQGREAELGRQARPPARKIRTWAR